MARYVHISKFLTQAAVIADLLYEYRAVIGLADIPIAASDVRFQG
jgi:hypothetical protein